MEERGSHNAGRALLEKDKSLSPTQESFLSTMERLLTLSQDLTLGPWERALVKRAIYSAYLDCVAAGVADQARDRLHSQQPQALVVR